ncbi:MAG TPA: ureidoglycolate lyase [Aestuariivirgaceae bacterium]|jgi:ureidoglycolate lyase
MPLTREGFASFGEVIETEGAPHYPINQGTAERFHDLARINMGENGTALVSIVVGNPRARPIALVMMERHPLASQAFIPLQEQDYLVVVAQEPIASSLRGFVAKGTQGVNYRRNVWHHPLLVLEPDSRFLLIDRGGVGNNLEEAVLAQTVYIS